jgi:Kae1-associated kinase Bud32
MKTKLLSVGAEATIEKIKLFGKEIVRKKRVPKKYRHSKLDTKLRKERTAHEAKILHEVKKWGVCSPILYLVDCKEMVLFMEFMGGPRLKHVLNNSRVTRKQKEVFCGEFGKIIAVLHKNGLVHGDLTTSNILVSKKSKKLVMIDFGLSFYSKKLEDLAVDLVNLKKTFTATHSDFVNGWNVIQKSYVKNGGEKAVLQQAESVEKRIRYA